MRFLFASAPLLGHLDWGGYLSTAVELVRRGHDVRWVSGQAVMPVLAAQGVPGVAVEETGWRWPLPPPLDPKSVGSREEYQRLRMVRSLDQWFELDRVRRATRDFLRIAEAWRPDVVVSEMFIAAAGIVAERLDVPFVVAGWPALRTSLPPQARFIAEMARQRLDALRAEFGVQGINWAADGPPALLSPHLHVSYWSPRWFAGLPLLPQNRHVGGIAPPSQPWQTPWLEHLPMDQPWIFITLGTAFTNDPNFFIAAAHAAVQVGGVPILAIGEDVNTPAAEQLRSRLPSGAVVAGRIHFAEVLPYAAAAIHHGGAGTTHALVTHAVPQIVVPHAADQGRQAEGVVRSG
ncbi:MAG: hypothetical protein D6790_01855, partial [Caldilineae bacterium]